MSSTPFGEHLRREREMRGVSLDEIAAATRISTRFLEALESEQWERLPGGAFNRGFIRSIARFLGIDEDALIAEYAFEHKDVEDARFSATHSEQIPRDWRPVAITTVALALLIAGGLFGYHRYGHKIADRIHARFARGTAESSSISPASPSSSATVSVLPKELSGSPNPTPAASALALTVQVSKPVDVTVVADGKTAFSGTLQANDTRQFNAQDTFEISSSEATALALSLNGRAISQAGTPGQPAKITLTRNDLQPAAEASH